MHSALVTGGNRGIGLEVCRLLSSKYGFKVYMGCRDLHKVSKILRNMRELNIIPIQFDISSEEEILKSCQRLLSSLTKGEKLFVVINNAAAALDWKANEFHYKTFEMPYEDLLSMYRINTISHIYIIKNLLCAIESGGRIVNVTSGSGEFSSKDAFSDFQIGYAPSKSAAIMTTKKLAAATQEFGIVVNSCCPGWCKTDMGGWNAVHSASSGAESIIKACFLNLDSPPTSGHWRHGVRIPIEQELQQSDYMMLSERAELAEARLAALSKSRWRKLGQLLRLHKVMPWENNKQ